MSEIELIVDVILLFALRIGLPVTIMLILGTLIEKRQQKKSS